MNLLPRNSIAAVIFDMDGLMLDTEPIYQTAWTLAIADCGLQLEDQQYNQLVGRSNSDCDRLLTELFGTKYPVERCRTLRDSYWQQSIRDNGIPLKPGLHELLDYLDTQQLPTAIATASERSEANLSIEASGIGPRFTHTTAGNEVPKNKPAPDIYLESARKLGVVPQQCLVFEDSNAGATAALQAGTYVIMVPDLQPPRPEVSQGVYRVLESLHDARSLLENLWGQNP